MAGHRPAALLRATGILCLSIGIAWATTARAEEDIYFLAEHAVESGMDLHYMSLPWPAERLRPGQWQQSVDLAAGRTTTDFIQLKGTIIAAAAARGLNDRWGFQAMASYGDLALSGDSGRSLLNRGYLNQVPLDLPNVSDFHSPRGAGNLFGVGAAAIRNLGGADATHSSQLIVGLLFERVAIDRFHMDYRLAGGANAGALGTLDYDSSANFMTPFVGWQQTRALSAHWTWSPRAMFMMPQPPRDLDNRITGPGFDLSTRGGTAIPIGDGFATLGLALRHEPSGLEVDLGGLLYFAVGEGATHPGVDNARVLHLAWRHSSR